MIDKADHNNPVVFHVRNAMEELIEKRKNLIQKNQGIKIPEDDGISHPQHVINCFNMFIRQNTNLQSLNLSNTGLNSQVFVGLI